MWGCEAGGVVGGDRAVGGGGEVEADGQPWHGGWVGDLEPSRCWGFAGIDEGDVCLSVCVLLEIAVVASWLGIWGLSLRFCCRSFVVT